MTSNIITRTRSFANFYLLLFSALTVALVHAFLLRGLFPINPPFFLGYTLGSFLFLVILPLLVAIILNFIFNLFRKNKKRFPYTVVWLVFILGTLLVLSSHP